MKCQTDRPKGGGGGNRGTKRKWEQAKKVKELESKIARAESIVQGLGMNVDLQFEQPVEKATVVKEISGMSDDESADSIEMAAPAQEKVIFRVDSGATSSFVNDEVDLNDLTSCNVVCEVADGRTMHIRKKGKFQGVTEKGTQINFNVKQAPEFSENLFSPHRAAKSGVRTVLDEEDSYLEYRDSGTIIPLARTATGWDLVLSQDVTAQITSGQ